MPDGNIPDLNNEEPVNPDVTPEEEEAPVATLGAAFTKKGYCFGCFHVVTWDAPTTEVTIMGNKVVYCPECGAPVNADTAEIVED